jgi:type IV pilus assembly protein PilY1
MNSQTRKATWTGAGLLLAFTVGTPAFADDTELMLAAPDTGSKPNILFILDTSGSMDQVVRTQEPYDASGEPYPGACDVNRIYWTDVDIPPDCSATTQSVAKSAFVCAAAAGRLAGIGSYSDTMVQHREISDTGVSRWQELQPGNSTDVVECQSDSGEHGEGTANYLWASNTAGTPFTNDPTREVAWGSAPAAVTYSVYDGNYLNWKSSPATVDLAKMDVLKAVSKAVLNSVTDVNVGIMRFQGNTGGTIIKAISDLDADRESILQTIDSLDADGRTPLSETMYEAALYWRGQQAHFGESFDPSRTDPAALISQEPEIYRRPQAEVCSKNFNVLLSDGLPTDDVATPELVVNLPGFPIGVCNASEHGDCLDDVAEYLSAVDTDPTEDGDQLVSTHTIGFAMDIPILRQTAEKSGGRYFQADDVETLAQAMLNIISEITERSLSFSSPSVSVNSFNRTQNLNDLYLTVFSPRTNVHWPGNLKKFALADGNIRDATGALAVDPETGLFHESARSIWTVGDADGNTVTLGGAAHKLPVPASRTVFSNKTTRGNLTAITPENFDDADFGLSGAAGEPSKQDLILWMHGQDIRDEDFDGSTGDVRNVMGDPLHSQPAAIVYGGSPEAPDVVVYAGTNDGYLHAIDGDTGEELWSFVPAELLGDMNRLFFDPKSNFKHYGIDGNIVPVMNDRNRNGEIESGEGDFAYILFGFRRGGNSFYALDVTDKNSPELLWVAQYPEFGQSWSTPVVTRVNVDHAGLNDDQAVVIIGGGYDPVHDTAAHPASRDAQGAGIHMLDLESGERLWWAGHSDTGANLKLEDMTRAIPTQVRAVDMSGDGRADRMYASDLGGQVWRFDISNGQPPATLVAGGVIAQLGAEGLESPSAADTRRFYSAPDLAIFNDPLQGRRFISISIGSGYRAQPLDGSAADRFFSIRDPQVFTQLSPDDYANYDVITPEDLVEVSNQVRVVVTSEDRGWQFTLPADQKVITDSVTFDDSVFFVGFSPEENDTDPCQPSIGRNFLYRVNVVNGDPVVNNLDQLLPEDADAERVTPLPQGGIAPTPAFLFPGATDPDCEGAACSPPPVACVGSMCFDPLFNNNPVRTLWTQDGVE